jgi:hypothetical protein
MRWYAALVAIGSYYGHLDRHEFKRIIRELRIARFAEDVRRAMSGDFSAFNGTTHVHAGRIMITG